jgi:hypothetical protein
MALAGTALTDLTEITRTSFMALTTHETAFQNRVSDTSVLVGANMFVM